MLSRLRRVTSARVGRWLALLVLVGFAACAVGLRAIDGPSASLAGLVTATARVSAWIGAGLVALAATNQRAIADRRDGLEILAAMRGATALRGLPVARFLATGFEATRVVLAPSLGVGVLVISLSGDAHVAALRALVLLPVVLFSAVSGFALALLAVACDAMRPTRGRSFFLGAIILPWALFDLLGHPFLSVPGALNGILSTGLDVLGLGALA